MQCLVSLKVKREKCFEEERVVTRSKILCRNYLVEISDLLGKTDLLFLETTDMQSKGHESACAQLRMRALGRPLRSSFRRVVFKCIDCT